MEHVKVQDQEEMKIEEIEQIQKELELKPTAQEVNQVKKEKYKKVVEVMTKKDMNSLL